MTSQARKIVFLTGPSGAGLSTASGVLEDCGFEAIDNLPLRMVRPLLELPGPGRPLSLGLDARNRDFSALSLLELVDELEQRADIELQLLYLDCAPGEISRRYSSTRRRHPLDETASLSENIAHEISALESIRKRADILIDTTDLNPHQLRAEVERWLSPDGAHQISLQIQSFSYRRGLPRGADFVFDCRFLRNPHWVEDLRPLDGRSERVQSYVEQDDRYAEFLEQVNNLTLFLLPAAREEGKSYLTIAFGCTGGKHRSVTLATKLGARLEKEGWLVSVRHRELDLIQQKETG